MFDFTDAIKGLQDPPYLKVLVSTKHCALYRHFFYQNIYVRRIENIKNQVGLAS